MVEPVSVGVVVAALIAKALGRAEDGVVDSAAKAARKALDALKRRFSDDPKAEQALRQLAKEPGSQLHEQSLAALLEERAADSVELRRELQEIVGQIEAAGVRIGDIEQVAEGDGNVQTAGVVNSQITINHGTSHPSRD